MKTFYKTPMTGTEALAKRKELEERTGLKLTCYSSRNGWNFLPYLHDDIESKYKHSQDIFDMLPTRGMDAVSFKWLSEEMRIPIVEVLEACQYIIKNGLATLVISRGGQPVGLYKTTLKK